MSQRRPGERRTTGSKPVPTKRTCSIIPKAISVSRRIATPSTGRPSGSTGGRKAREVRSALEKIHQRHLGERGSLRGSGSQFQRDPSVDDTAEVDTVPGRSGSLATRAHNIARQQGSSRSREGPGKSRLLQQPVPGSKKGANSILAPCHRPLDVKQIPDRAPFQDGDSQVREGGFTADGFYNVYRPHGRVSAYTDTQVVQEVSEICVPGGGLPILCPAIWLGHRPLRVYTCDEAGHRPASSEPNLIACLPGRLVVSAPGARGTESADQCNSGVVQQARPDCQHPEIAGDPDPGICISGLSVHDSTGPSMSDPRTGRQSHSDSAAVLDGAIHVLPTMDAPSRSDVLYGGPDSIGKPLDETVSAALTGAQETHAFSRVPRVAHCDRSCQTSPATNSECNGLEPRSPNLSLQSVEVSIHGREYSRLGRSPGRPLGLREMERPGSGLPYQSAGEQGSSAGTPTTSPRRQGTSCPTVHGQHDDVGVCQQRGGHEVVVFDANGPRDSVSLPGERHPSKGDSHKGVAKRHGGRSVTITSSDPVRVGVESTDGRNSVANPLEARNRPIRNQMECEATKIHGPVSRRTGGSSRRSGSELGGSERLRVSTLQHSKQSGQQDSQLPGPSTAVDSAMVGGSTVVSNTKTVKHHRAHAHSDVARSAKAAKVQFDARSLDCVKSSRVDIICQALKARGFPTKAAEFMSNNVRQSSEKVYQTQWSAFVKWCTKEGMNPFRLSTPKLSAFFTFLFDEKNLQVSSIRSYVTVIVQTIQSVTGKEISRSEITNMLKGMQVRRPHVKKVFPEWELSVVLDKLRRAPFEPMGTCDEKFLTFKTVFLVTLASAARRSEIHAVSRKFVHAPDWSFVKLSLLSDFLPKNQSNSSGESREFTISAIASFVGRDMKEDLVLCPVRAIRYYSRRMHTLASPQKRRFFVSFKPGFDKDIHANTVSSWLKQTVILAYKLDSSSSESSLIQSPRGHQIRSYAASLANHCNIALSEIMKACFWAGQTTFSAFYCRDMVKTAEGLFKLSIPPTIAMGRLVCHTPSGGPPTVAHPAVMQANSLVTTSGNTVSVARRK